MRCITWIPWMVRLCLPCLICHLSGNDETELSHSTRQVLLCAASQHVSKCTSTFSRCSFLPQGILRFREFPTPRVVIAPLYCHSLWLTFLLCVFCSVVAQWVLRGMNYNFHSIQSSSHPKSGLAFCQIQQLRRVQRKLQKWIQRFLKSPGATSSSFR